jgi:hypothetical protein
MNDLTTSDFAGLEYSHKQRTDERQWADLDDEDGENCSPEEDALLLSILTAFVVLLCLLGYYGSSIVSLISFLFLKVMP